MKARQSTIKNGKPFKEWMHNYISDKPSFVKRHLIPDEEGVWEEARFSDFIENHNEKNIKLYHSTRVDNISGSTTKFLLIPKTNISYYEPFDEKRNL